MNQKEIERKYTNLIRRRENLNKQIDLFRDYVKDICEHSIIDFSSREHDDGYGKWWTVKIEYCKICGKELGTIY